MTEREVEVAEATFMKITRCVCTDGFGIPLARSGASLSSRFEAVMFHFRLLGIDYFNLWGGGED